MSYAGQSTANRHIFILTRSSETAATARDVSALKENLVHIIRMLERLEQQLGDVWARSDQVSSDHERMAGALKCLADQLEVQTLQIGALSEEEMEVPARLTGVNARLQDVDHHLNALNDRLANVGLVAVASLAVVALVLSIWLACCIKTNQWKGLDRPQAESRDNAMASATHPLSVAEPTEESDASVDERIAGVVSRKGHVRSDNQDRARAISINGRHAIILADGMGGLPAGADAAEAAVNAAVHTIQMVYGDCASPGLDPSTVAAVAIFSAQAALATAADRNPKLKNGYRTTLMVAILDADDLGWAYIGDGGGCVRCTDGTIVQFLKPMKTLPGSNVIEGSLGPEPDGRPNSGKLKVKPGDLVLLGTDGLLDYDWQRNTFVHVESAAVTEAILEAVTEFAGHVGNALAAIADDLICQRSNDGQYVIDDNSTLGAMVVPATKNAAGGLSAAA